MITARSFPTPDLLKRTNNPAAWDQLAGFAQVQAAEANAALQLLSARLADAGSTAERAAAFEAAFRHVSDWRYEVAAEQRWTRPGSDVEEFRTAIEPDNARIYWITPSVDEYDPGSPGLLLRTELDQVARDRLMGHSALQNVVTLRDGRTINGNLLNRSIYHFGVTTETAAYADREVLRQASFETLAELETQRADEGRLDPHDPELRQKFTDAAYFLIQAPEMKRGSDAIMRTFLVTAHTQVFDAAPVLPQAIDLDGMVRGQQGFNEVMQDQLRVLPPAKESGPAATGPDRAPQDRAVRRTSGMER
ncbi:hypothetical protein [Kribbella sp. NPDC004536]|uniref:hypothetical protein n=1 Tax=Kribbella sp. NPDC004536 TaxID=3364106 RepID=UPI0036AFE32C